MKTLVDTKCLVVWEHDGEVAVWRKAANGGYLYASAFDGRDISCVRCGTDRHDAEEWLRLKWGVEVPATEDDVGRMVMVRDREEDRWTGPRKLRAVWPDRIEPYVANSPGREICTWNFARLATEDECKGVEK